MKKPTRNIIKNQKLNIIHFNCRGIGCEERLYELEKSFEKVKWDVIGLSEVRKMGEKLIKRKNNNYLYFFGETIGYRGTGFYINRRIIDIIIKIEGVTERISLMKVELSRKVKILIVQVYAPTMDANEEEIEKFYSKLREVYYREKEYYNIIVGGWNAKIGKADTEKETVGKFGLGTRNRNGDTLVDFALETRLKIVNTFYNKKEKHKWTWISPDENTRNEIDHLLSNDKTIIDNIGVLTGCKFPSDHRPVRCTISIPQRPRYNNYRNKTEGGNKIINRIIPKHKIPEAMSF